MAVHLSDVDVVYLRAPWPSFDALMDRTKAEGTIMKVGEKAGRMLTTPAPCRGTLAQLTSGC